MPAGLLIQIAIKSSIALSGAWLATFAMRRCSSAARHLVWTLGLLATLALPVLEAVGPSWTVSLPVPFIAPLGSTPADRPEQRGPSTIDAGEIPVAAPLVADPVDHATSSGPAHATDTPWPLVVIGIWLLGTLIALAQLVAGLVTIRLMVSRAVPVEDASWRAELASAAAALAMTRVVPLQITDRTTVPLVCGLWRASILLPLDADRWTADRRRVVLVHELAHVARRDCVVLALARFVRALHWFNPLAYVAACRLRVEQERAADDRVLGAGTDASAYADHLLEIVRAFRTARTFEGLAVAMARPSEIEGRLMAILDERRNRVPLSRTVRACIGVAAVAGLVPLAAVQVSGAAIIDAAPANAGAIAAATSWPTAMAPMSPRIDPYANGAEAGTPAFAAPDPAPAQTPVPPPPPGLGAAQVPAPDPAPAQAPVPPSPPRPGAAQVPAPPTPGVRVDVPFGIGSSADAETRRRVADALVMALDDSNERVRAQALTALASMRDERAVPGLIKALSDTEVDVRTRAIDGLQQFDTPQAGDALARALNDTSPDVREHAATALGNVRNRRAVAPLLQALKDADAAVRRRAAWALGAIADPAAIDGLTAALKDADPTVREQVARSLGSIARGRPVASFKSSASFDVDVSHFSEIVAQANERVRRELKSFGDQLHDLPALPEPPPAPVPR